ncbi:MAG: cytochrome-c peroxidase [Leptospiraceae bacterium]|nr:cytochrome-c peroxidase [Leptospiraceae bacterium]MDW7976290.1 cytochrome-c peroxidase [Leptospiraceae bacterium]
MKTFFVLTATLIFLTHVSCKQEDQKAKELIQKANQIFKPIPEKMPGFENVTPEQIELGKKLYFDKRLSVNDQQSCNSCHVIDNNGPGVDNKPVSDGAIAGRKGDRNSPTVLNAGFHIAQFWDGRAKDLVEQAKGPILNPVEMAMPSEKEVVKKISTIAEYKEMFPKAFPNEKDPITYDNIAKAIAAFESTLITKDRFDDFLKGDTKALTAQEMKGLETFIEVGCASCHNGALVGGSMYQKMGVMNPYENTKDFGRYNVTKKEEDKYVFKVPSLRNVALTAPYFHDGSVGTLEEAVRKMAWLQLNKQLKDEEVQNIVAFLKALTDKSRSK